MREDIIYSLGRRGTTSGYAVISYDVPEDGSESTAWIWNAKVAKFLMANGFGEGP